MSSSLVTDFRSAGNAAQRLPPPSTSSLHAQNPARDGVVNDSSPPEWVSSAATNSPFLEDAREIVIYAARFQPLHNGHLYDLRTAHRRLQLGASLILGVVTAATECNAAAGPTANEHFNADRNPWPPTVCCYAAARIAALLERERSGIPVVATLLPRPTRSWPLIIGMLPGKRTWVIPERGEEHDERKAAFFAARGDDVWRIPSPRTISGRSIRAAIAEGKPGWADQLPPAVASIYMPADGTK